MQWFESILLHMKIEFVAHEISETDVVVKLKDCFNAFGEPIYVGPNGPTDNIKEAVRMPAHPDLIIETTKATVAMRPEEGNQVSGVV